MTGPLGPADPLFLSPMVDVTDAAFRSLAREQGADITCSEMVSAEALVRGHAAAWRHAAPWPGESPYGVQVMGGDPDSMAQSVRLLAEHVPGLSFVDVNLGCPSPRVLRSCAGGFLLKDPRRAGRVLAAAVDAGEGHGVPVSAKMRLGMDARHRTYVEVGREAEAAGAAWVTLHGRTVDQGYSGTADWDAIARLVDDLGIPVVGNGDLRTPEDVLAMRERTACRGFFIARAAMQDPTVFRRMRAALDGRPPPPQPGLGERLSLLLEYLARAEACGIGDAAALKRQAGRFMAGARGAKRLRVEMQGCRDVAAVKQAVLRAQAGAP